MSRGCRRLSAHARRLTHAPLGELVDLFEPWLRLPATFGAPAKNRLFFPLTHLLALSLPSPRG